MAIGRFLAGIGAVIWCPALGKTLLLQRSAAKDFAPGMWECVTGRVDQGEGYEEALRREVCEELGVEVTVDFILGTTHFFRGTPAPETELLGVVYHCTLQAFDAIALSAEHQAYRWVTDAEAEALLGEGPSEAWLRRVLARAAALRGSLPPGVIAAGQVDGFELG